MSGDLDEITEIVTGRPRRLPYSHVWERAERHLADGDAPFLADLGAAVHERYGAAPRFSAEGQWCSAVVDHLVALLCLAPDHVTEAIRLLVAIGSARQDHRAAALLAQNPCPGRLDVAFDAPGASTELRACLVQELVLRGVPVESQPALVSWTETPAWRQHPLAWLPLELSPVEGRPELGEHTPRTSAAFDLFGPSDVPETLPDLRAVVPDPFEVDLPTRDTAASPFANWACSPEVRSFELSSPLQTDAVPAMLAGLGLDCLRGLDEQTRFSISACEPPEAWSRLFAAAYGAGAYSPHRYNAHGRLLAWRALAGLCGLSQEHPQRDVERAALACEWYRFDAATPWFEQVAWDLGLAVLGPGRRRLTILAATDTD